LLTREPWLAEGVGRQLYKGEVNVSDPATRAATVAFGPFRLLPTQQLLLEADRPVRLGSRAFQILIALVERAGELVSKEELIARVWPNTVVEEASVRVHVAALRRILGDGQAGNRYVATIPGRGYCFVAPVSQSEGSSGPSEGLRTSTDAPERSLPAPLTRMVGREGIADDLAAQLLRQRLITLVGPGGIGKTTVAVAVAQRLSKSYEDGVRFVDLVPLADPLLVQSAVASTLGLPVRSENSLPSLLAFLKEKRMLLVLDNCEHVIEPVAAFAAQVLAIAPGVHIFATSREPLFVSGERVKRLSPLPFPLSTNPTAAEAMTSPAVQLFVERAAASIDGFELRSSDAPIVVEICRRLDGIPLAIELAAGSVDVFGVRGLASGLDDRFRLLTRGRRTALPRHRTLAAVLDWSYGLLAEPERAILRHLSVFAGDFTLESASIVAADADLPAADVVEGVANLVTKSLITPNVAGAVAQYRLLDTTRAYARKKLDEHGERDEFMRRHAEYLRTLFERAEVQWETLPTNEWLATYQSWIDDLRIALDWAFSQNGDAAIAVALTVAAVPLWFQLSLINECRGRVERSLAILGSESGRSDRQTMKLYAALGWSLMYTSGPARETGAAWATALELAEEFKDTDYRLRALWGLWAGTVNNGEFRAALALAKRFDNLAAVAADGADRHIGDRLIGVCLHFLGDQLSARRHIERMLGRYVAPLSRSHAVRFQFDQQITARITLSRVLWLQGFADRALRVVEDNIDHARSNALARGACPVTLLAGARAPAERFTSMLIEQTEKHSLGIWHSYGNGFQGELLIKAGNVEAGLSLLQAGVDELRRARFVQYHTTFLRALAEGFAAAEDIAEGLEAIDEALFRSEGDEERWCIAELLSKVAGLSRCHFVRAFRQSVGATPHNFLIYRRFRKAVDFITGTDLPLAEIALAAGFADQSHFSRRFRQYLGVSPSSFRRSHR
jgi:predicted ATPase/DNA-binding winged helix-turn-helix (wHTH) protein/AraC-like DNA-binding protein